MRSNLRLGKDTFIIILSSFVVSNYWFLPLFNYIYSLFWWLSLRTSVDSIMVIFWCWWLDKAILKGILTLKVLPFSVDKLLMEYPFKAYGCIFIDSLPIKFVFVSLFFIKFTSTFYYLCFIFYICDILGTSVIALFYVINFIAFIY